MLDYSQLVISSQAGKLVPRLSVSSFTFYSPGTCHPCPCGRRFIWAKIGWAKIVWLNSFGQKVLWSKFVRAKLVWTNSPLDKTRLDKRSFGQKVLWTNGPLDKWSFGQNPFGQMVLSAKLVWTKGPLDKNRLDKGRCLVAIRREVCLVVVANLKTSDRKSTRLNSSH